MKWFNEPGKYKVPSNAGPSDEGYGGSWKLNADKTVLTLAPDSKKDFWRRTFDAHYGPLMIKNDGPCLFKKVAANKELVMEIYFDLKAKGKFDHCGLMVYADPDHWFKTGIEIVDGKPLLGTVVTNTYSDWSAQNWDSSSLRLRVTQKGNGTYIVEALGKTGY